MTLSAPAVGNGTMPDGKLPRIALGMALVDTFKIGKDRRLVDVIVDTGTYASSLGKLGG